MAYFERLSPTAFRATEHVSGAWDEATQHIAPALGLMVHVVEADRDARRDDGLVVGRLSYDILGTIPVDEMDSTVTVLRPGRTIELVEARLSHAGRDGVVLRAWLMQPGDTHALAATPLPRIPGPDDMPAWDPSSEWPGGFIASAQVRRAQVEPGRAAFWVRSDRELVAGEPVSRLAHAARLLDIANGMTVRASPREVLFPNIDLTAHFFAQPEGEWLGFDTSVSFGATGVGLTSTVLHDVTGPVGTMSQVLTVRPS
ncbi:thioesterase family protein [Ornithinimicrobium sp. F0845]|uniref:thioesterase family protein n=1 Tax=Ornithinimicrobium sp. F0845 TaxID=2926412 RepID=UPI001FF657B2|nr:thioesterase family protein [Ornithinimicrobium sp. F0845]MCK0112986.1 thioesterase family protein [Ornithinimicrobium sp. F0845]